MLLVANVLYVCKNNFQAKQSYPIVIKNGSAVGIYKIANLRKNARQIVDNFVLHNFR